MQLLAVEGLSKSVISSSIHAWLCCFSSCLVLAALGMLPRGDTCSALACTRQLTATLSSTASQALCICLGLPTTHVQSVGWDRQLQGPCVSLAPV